jgi:hypothetical protein
VSLDSVTGSGSAAALRGADAVARAGSILSTQAVRQRNAPLDAFQLASRPSSQKSRATSDQQPDDRRGQATQSETDGQDSRSTTQAASTFVAQSLAQEQDQTSTAPASQIAAGLRAYARSTGGASATPRGDSTVEIIPPQLSSGHSLDLAV